MRKGLTLYFAICFLVGPLLPLCATNQNELLASIEMRLQNIILYSQRLEEELQSSNRISDEQRQNIERQLSELASLRIRLQASEISSKHYKNQVSLLLDSIRTLETKLGELSRSCERTVKPLQEALDLAEKQMHRQKIKTVIYTVLAVVAGGVAGYGIRGIAE